MFSIFRLVGGNQNIAEIKWHALLFFLLPISAEPTFHYGCPSALSIQETETHHIEKAGLFWFYYFKHNRVFNALREMKPLLLIATYCRLEGNFLAFFFFFFLFFLIKPIKKIPPKSDFLWKNP